MHVSMNICLETFIFALKYTGQQASDPPPPGVKHCCLQFLIWVYFAPLKVQADKN